MMIGQPKPFASLSSGLLARKGHARPAMRPQGFGGFGHMGTHEDLGWNDMGHDYSPAEEEYIPRATSLTPLTPVDEPEAYEAEDAGEEEPVVLPQVLRQREVLKEEFTVEEPVEEEQQSQLAASEPDFEPEPALQSEPAFQPEPVFQPEPEFRPEPAIQPESEPVAIVSLSPARVARIGQEVSSRKTKAAFTLRLDAERHLRLRLANAMTGRSSQQIVTEALDAFLATLPEVTELAGQVSPRRVATSG